MDKRKAAALLDTFAEMRRTWDELVGLQPDIALAGGPFTGADLVRLSQALVAHQNAADKLKRAIMELQLGDV
ncbi:MAG TPA: hypothetical protein VL243_08145 [Vicinamibacterales bacterium]|nr:hypothetical protein [Vicinamibacterales bacterium]